MAQLTDPTRLNAYKDALGNWKYGGFNDGYIKFELTDTAFKWIKRELDGITLKEIGRLMHAYVEAGGEIDEVRETRPEWSDHEFHYDLRFEIQNKPVYIESRLHFQVPLVSDESTILVVSIHAP